MYQQKKTTQIAGTSGAGEDSGAQGEDYGSNQANQNKIEKKDGGTPFLDAAAGGTPAKNDPPMGGLSPWYVGPPSCTMPEEYKAVPANERTVRSYFPDGSTTALKLFTTKTAWQQFKDQTDADRRAEVTAQAAAINAGDQQPPYDAGIVEWSWARSQETDKNGFYTYYLKPKAIPEHDPYKLGFDSVTWQAYQRLMEEGWPNAQIQSLYNIKPGYHTDFGDSKKTPSADGGKANTVRYTEYAWKHIEDLAPFERKQLEALKPG